jgi:hypothetical protein
MESSSGAPKEEDPASEQPRREREYEPLTPEEQERVFRELERAYLAGALDLPVAGEEEA